MYEYTRTLHILQTSLVPRRTTRAAVPRRWAHQRTRRTTTMTVQITLATTRSSYDFSRKRCRTRRSAAQRRRVRSSRSPISSTSDEPFNTSLLPPFGIESLVGDKHEEDRSFEPLLIDLLRIALTRCLVHNRFIHFLHTNSFIQVIHFGFSVPAELNLLCSCCFVYTRLCDWVDVNLSSHEMSNYCVIEYESKTYSFSGGKTRFQLPFASFYCHSHRKL